MKKEKLADLQAKAKVKQTKKAAKVRAAKVLEVKGTPAKQQLKLRKRAMLEALRNTMGIISAAADMVGIDRGTHAKWMKQDKKYRAEVEDIDEKSIDFAESKLLQRIKGSTLPDSKVFMGRDKEGKSITITVPMTKHLPPDTQAIMFYLNAKGKARGYQKTIDVTSKGEKLPSAPPPAPGVIIMLDDGMEDEG